MRLIRGWESRYAPDATGGLRLSKASLYRCLGEEEGLGDQREGEIRISDEGEISVDWNDGEVLPFRLSDEMQEAADAEFSRAMREHLAAATDDPDVEVEKHESGVWKIRQNLRVDDSMVDSPFLFCLSREPSTRANWERLRTALPERYDTWTMTEDLNSLQFEIEVAFKRWMGLNQITRHKLLSYKSWVEYPYDTIPPSGHMEDLGELVQVPRWFRKRRKYKDQEEYRFAWLLETPQWANLPDAIDIELTRTGLELFQPWKPSA